jgi:hypothetical protein
MLKSSQYFVLIDVMASDRPSPKHAQKYSGRKPLSTRRMPRVQRTEVNSYQMDRDVELPMLVVEG